MNRQPVSPACGALLNALRPGPRALLNRCRSLSWAMGDCAGERIEIEFKISNELAIKRARRLAALAAKIVLPGAVLAKLSLSISGNLILFDALLIAS